ncbi:MAG: hypothetical protein LBP78_06915 [Acidaminococcales bacterium]|jgi:hypothetical protein|nr:hypothetical protein [Acidaminococcales bacterium]
MLKRKVKVSVVYTGRQLAFPKLSKPAQQGGPIQSRQNIPAESIQSRHNASFTLIALYDITTLRRLPIHKHRVPPGTFMAKFAGAVFFAGKPA